MSTWATSPDSGKIFQSSVQLGNADFARLAKFIYETCGIQLNASKQLMVESRLQKRVRETGAGTFSAYWKLLNSDAGGNEIVHLIDTITTNKTDFFREPAHFEFLVKKIVPTLGKDAKTDRRPFRVWSAGCSTGMEPYTLAMVLSDCRPAGSMGEFSILATDICTQVLNEAKRAIYKQSEIEPIPIASRKKYLLKSRNVSASRVADSTFRLAPEIRELVHFEQLNFMDHTYAIEKPVDIIFCRNVMIYFDRMTQESVVNKFHSCLRPGGYLFIGHSETLNGLSTPLISAAPTIYRKEPRS